MANGTISSFPAALKCSTADSGSFFAIRQGWFPRPGYCSKHCPGHGRAHTLPKEWFYLSVDVHDSEELSNLSFFPSSPPSCPYLLFLFCFCLLAYLFFFLSGVRYGRLPHPQLPKTLSRLHFLSITLSTISECSSSLLLHSLSSLLIYCLLGPIIKHLILFPRRVHSEAICCIPFLQFIFEKTFFSYKDFI